MQAKEENILLCAEKLFAEKGFDGTSTREIAKMANVNISMISYYFESKDKLFERIFEHRLNESLSFANLLLENKDMPSWDKLMLLIDRFLERVKKNRNFYLIVQREQINKKNDSIINYIQDFRKELLTVYKKIVDEGVKNGEFKKPKNIKFIQYTVSGTTFLVLNSLDTNQKNSLENEKEIDRKFKELGAYLKNILQFILTNNDEE